MTDRIITTGAYEALHAFDAEHGTEPTRTIAKRIAVAYLVGRDCVTLTDEIQQALENAMELGRKRGPLEDAAKRVKHG